jgi:hypothetical protein
MNKSFLLGVPRTIMIFISGPANAAYIVNKGTVAIYSDGNGLPGSGHWLIDQYQDIGV